MKHAGNNVSAGTPLLDHVLTSLGRNCVFRQRRMECELSFRGATTSCRVEQILHLKGAEKNNMRGDSQVPLQCSLKPRVLYATRSGPFVLPSRHHEALLIKQGERTDHQNLYGREKLHLKAGVCWKYRGPAPPTKDERATTTTYSPITPTGQQF
jgi:hypothetical protein